MSELERPNPIRHPAAENHEHLPFITRTALQLRDVVDRFANTSPAQLSIVVFVVVDLFFATLLWLPFSSAPGVETRFVDAFFTSTSAVTVTGLTTVSTAENWSSAGRVVIAMTAQVGGLGTLTMTSLLALAIGRRMGLKSRLVTQQALNSGRLGDVGSLLRTVVVTSLVIEAILAAIISLGLWLSGEPLHQAIGRGMFYAISCFNNAGFSPHADGLLVFMDSWVTQWLVLTPLAAGVFLGSLGFPVWLVLQTSGFRLGKWDLHTKLTIVTTTGLMLLGSILFLAFEWTNSSTIGEMSFWDKVYNGWFGSVMMRSGGFNLVEVTDERQITLLLSDAMMFVGGGSASTAGGIKVSTLAVLFLAILAEARGDQSIIAFFRTIPVSVLRLAVSVVFMGATVVLVSSCIVVTVSDAPLDHVLFETISAFATCGLSSGVSAETTDAGKYTLALTMLVGRIGVNTMATALALRSRQRLYNYPEERPLIG